MVCYTHLKFYERYVIYCLLKLKIRQSTIALTLNRSESTIWREIDRNSGNNKYLPKSAQQNYLFRRVRNGFENFSNNNKLLSFVLSKLTLGLSPEQISIRLKILYKNNFAMRLSHETIYKYIYELAKVGIDFCQYLRKKKKKRKNRKNKAKKTLKNGFKTIHSRDKNENMDEIGHWESDLIEGKKGKGFIITIVERISKYLFAYFIKNKDINSFNNGLKNVFANIDNDKLKSITHDRGSEAYDFVNIELMLNCNMYYADPGSPWQRGLNENTNGLLREYFPKGSDFSKLNQKQVYKAVELLNNRPRKILDGKTPKEVLHNLPVKDNLHFKLNPPVSARYRANAPSEPLIRLSPAWG